MTNAYPEIYLDRTMTTLGEMFDYAVNDCNIDGEEFTREFVNSAACRRLENCEPAYLLGKSGVEIASEIIGDAAVEPKEEYWRSPEYWCGWASCYYQWLTGRKYSELFNAVPFDEMIGLYTVLHEADEMKAAEVFDKRVKSKFTDTNLKRIRTAYGCSQAELAELSGVSVRSIQMYEQRKKDVNKAGAGSLLKLARVLGCGIEDLLEAETVPVTDE